MNNSFQRNSRVWPTALFLLCLIAAGGFLYIAVHRKTPPTSRIKVGAILPLSGASGKYGKYIQEGLEMAKKELNASAESKSGQIEILYEDDQAMPKFATSAMEKFASRGDIPVVFGSWSSSCVLAQAPIAQREGIFVMAEAISPKIRDAGDFTFRIQPDGPVYMKALASFACRKMGRKTIAILFVNNDYGVDLAQSFRRFYEDNGGKVLYEAGFEQGQTDFRGRLTVAKEGRPEAMLFIGYTEVGQILRQAKELDISTQFFASTTFENPDIAAIAGDAGEGVIYPQHFDGESSDSAVKDFQRRFEAEYGSPPEGYAVLAYDAFKLVAGCIVKNGNDRAALRPCFMSSTIQGVTGPVAFDSSRGVKGKIYIKWFHNGHYVTLDKTDQ